MLMRSMKWLIFFVFQLNFLYVLGSNCKRNLTSLKCHGNFTPNMFSSKTITELYLVNLNWDVLFMNNILYNYPFVENLFVEYNDIESIILPSNPKNNTIKVFSLRYNQIEELDEKFIKYFPKLKILYLEHNQLKRLGNNFFIGKLEILLLKHNPWECTLDMSWAINLNKTNVVKDLNETTCKGIFSGKKLLSIANYKQDMNKNCTKSCTCTLEYVAQDLHSDQQHPIIMVNCSGKGFKELPTEFPQYTRILHLERNEINDLMPLKTNPVFRSVWDLYLDNNTVTRISYLEGSHWIQNFRVFSLRGNQLQKIPSFALDNALVKNPNMPGAVRLYLGNNPWRCDCIFVPVFQEYVLQKYANNIPDINDVKCNYVEGDENSLLSIASLSRSSVCMVPSDFSLQEGLDILNAILASLIIFILGKLAYDYYHFKKSGRLPWIVTKMP